MDDEWKLLISEATDEIRRLPTEKAVKENKLEEDSAPEERRFTGGNGSSRRYNATDLQPH
ncbi:MAG: hypothetical protein WCE82_06830 [Halobacteriota archaeon]